MAKMVSAQHPKLTTEEKFEKQLALSAPYYRSDRDDEFVAHLEQQAMNFRAHLNGGGLKQCALFVLGDSNSGKTKMLNYHFARLPHYQPVPDGNGNAHPCVVHIECPASASTKAISIAIFGGMGITASARATEVELYTALKRVLKANGIHTVVIDEVQHIDRGTAASTIKKVQDALKSLLQISDWPIQFIFLGTYEAAAFLEGDRQFANRCRVMRLRPLDWRAEPHIGYIEALVKMIIVDTANLKIGWADHMKLYARLCRSAQGALGAVIETTREACFRAISEDRDTVTIDDFAAVYRANSGCLVSDNLFLSADWAIIDPAKAVSDLSAQKNANKKRK